MSSTPGTFRELSADHVSRNIAPRGAAASLQAGSRHDTQLHRDRQAVAEAPDLGSLAVPYLDHVGVDAGHGLPRRLEVAHRPLPRAPQRPDRDDPGPRGPGGLG